MEIRTMRPAELDLALDWAAAEGWNPGLHDAAAFAAVDPDGLLVGLVGGEPAATIAAVRYDDAFAFVGLYIVRPDLRGHGYGRALWDAAHERLAGVASGLDGVDAQVPFYARSGYELETWTYRYEGRGGARATDREDVRPVTAADVTALDARAFPAPREGFLRAWTSAPDGRALGLYRDGALAGYGVLRVCRTGWKVGPLFAPDAAGAEALLDALVGGIDGPYWVDVPEANAPGTALVRDRGMTPTFRTARMYRDRPPAYDRDLVFGVTTLELG